MLDTSSATPGLERELPKPAQVQFSVVRNPERSAEVDELRRIAYGEAGKSGPGSLEAGEVIDPRDLQAFVVIAEVAGRVVGSVRVIPPMPGPILHPECRLRGDTSSLPPRSGLAEGGWGCVHPDYQGQGLFWQLAAHMLLLGRDLGGTHLVAGSDVDLWPYWRRCGFSKTGVSYLGVHSGTEHAVMVIGLDALTSGRNMAPEFSRVLMPLAADLRRPLPPAGP